MKNKLDLSPTDLNIDRGHLLIKDYLPTKFKASAANHSLTPVSGVEDQHDL